MQANVVETAWPQVAPEVPVVDVVVCHHVVYNVAHLASFTTALTDHARRRVVLELTAVHPMAWLAPYWEAMYGLIQPRRPVAVDALAVLLELGFAVGEQRWQREYQMIGESGDDSVDRIARRLCLPKARYNELRRVLAAVPPPPVPRHRHSLVVTSRTRFR